MEIDFSKPGKAEKSLEEAVEAGGTPGVNVSSEEPVKDLYSAVKLLKDRASWVKNVGIKNKHEERERFLDQDNREPQFEFRSLPHNPDTLLEVLEAVAGQASKIDDRHLERYGARVLEAEDLEQLFQGVFREFSLWVELASNLENREAWKRFSELLWPMVDEKTAKKSRKRLEKLDPDHGEKTVRPRELKKMMESEVERLGMEYKVETRKLDGCFNIPEDRTLVVAEGENRDRMYSEEEARMVTIHETFHAARSFNGFEAGRDSGFPPVLGVHTPFYDRTDEGGAVYREYATGVSYDAREFDYHLRLMAAYYLSQGRDFPWVIQKLQDLGGSRRRSFDLVARNRGLIRHHIYWAGYLDWKEIDHKQPLLLGKVNHDWAEKLAREVEAGGMITGPAVGVEELFDYSFKD